MTTCPDCAESTHDLCVWCDDLDRERNDGRAVDRGDH